MNSIESDYARFDSSPSASARGRATQLHLAREWGSQCHHVSASWFVRWNGKNHDLTVNKLVVTPTFVRCQPRNFWAVDPGNAQAPTLKPFSIRMPPSSSPRGALGANDNICFRTDLSLTNRLTRLRCSRRKLVSPGQLIDGGIIERLDRTIDPMIPIASIVRIDTRKSKAQLLPDDRGCFLPRLV